MFKCYNLKITNDTEFSAYFDAEKLRVDGNKAKIKSNIDAFVNKNGILSADKIMGNWFPELKCNVFISHSHKDNDVAIGLSGYLNKKFGLTSFIDSCVWGHSDKLIRILDQEYSWADESKTTYSYDKRNRSTAHVHMMLSTALAKMINNCECVIFLNTPSSISSKGYIGGNTTQSAWLYSEIAMTSLIEVKRPKRMATVTAGLERLRKSINEDVEFEYNANLGHMTDISSLDLKKWGEACAGKTGESTLDKLYALK